MREGHFVSSRLFFFWYFLFVCLESALAGHPKDGSPQIRRLIQMADPHKTLEELAYTSEIELSQVRSTGPLPSIGGDPVCRTVLQQIACRTFWHTFYQM